MRKAEKLPAHPVTVDGIVSGVFTGKNQLGGFYLQQQPENNIPVGIFVYTPQLSPKQRAKLQPGKHVQVKAVPGKFRSRLQLQQLQSVALCGTAELRSTALPLPLEHEERKAYLDILVHTETPLIVTQNYDLHRYGSLELTYGGMRFRPTQLNDNTDVDHTPRSIVLDDGSYRQFPEPIPYLDENGTRRIGSQVKSLQGIFTFAFDKYRIHPVEPPVFKGGERPKAPSSPSLGSLRIATFNVENYFISLGKRGAKNTKEFQRQSSKIAAAFNKLQAHVIAVVELENSKEALNSFLQLVNHNDIGRYRGTIGTSPGSDAITTALIYDSRAVKLLEADSLVSPVWQRNPVLGHFALRQEPQTTFYIAGVHFKSKIGCPSEGDIDRGQGCWNLQRTDQARSLTRWAQGVSSQYPTILAGDFNSYAYEKPIDSIVEAGFTQPLLSFIDMEDYYTYVFFGEAGTLDYLFTTPLEGNQITGAGIWHINADEPPFLAYDSPLPHLVRPDPYRSSDHNPLWIDLQLKEQP
nr:ExeM/NucH family extracellular endonuclease [Desulfurispira natronophila]